MKVLAHNRGDIKRLEGKLEDYSRLRVAGHRVLFCERVDQEERIIDCVFAEKRAVVYELMIRLLRESIGSTG